MIYKLWKVYGNWKLLILFNHVLLSNKVRNDSFIKDLGNLWITETGIMYVPFFCLFRTLNQFVEAKVVTNIQSTTEDLSMAKFPKLVLKNKYDLRWRKKINYTSCKHLFLSRQSFIDSLLYPDFTNSEYVAWAFYKDQVSGFEVS